MYYGSHLLFSTMPLWAIALLCYVIMAVPIQVLRNHYEGMQYQVAWSADFGCSALVAIALVGASILQRGVLLPDFLGSRGFHSLAVVVAVAVGVVWTKLDWHTQWGDRYHHAVVAPVLTYLLFTLLPVIFWGGGTTVEVVATITLFIVFAILTALDIRQKRMNQPQWIREHVGATFKNDPLICGECGVLMKHMGGGRWKCFYCGWTRGCE